jgi:hypothetical protein
MSNVYADCIAQQAKLGIVRGAVRLPPTPLNPLSEETAGKGKASKALAIAKADFKHKFEEIWLLNGKGWRYSVVAEFEEVVDGGVITEVPGEIEVVIEVPRLGSWVGRLEPQPQDPDVGEVSIEISIWSGVVAKEEEIVRGVDFFRSQWVSENTGIS